MTKLKQKTKVWDADYLDNQYSNRLRVPDFITRHVQSWQSRSAQVRAPQACVLDWVYRNIDQYGGDPQRISVAGHCAGGHLATMLLACQWPKFASDLPAQLVRSALGISGLYDLLPIRHTPYLQSDLKLTPSQVQRCSPAYFAAPGGSLFAVCGDQESAEFKNQNRLMEMAWGRPTVPVCETVAGLNHFSILEALVTSGQRVHVLALQMLAA